MSATNDSMNISSATSSTVSSITMGFTVLLLMLVVALWLIRKARASRPRSAGIFQVLASQSIGPAQQLALVRIGDRTLLLGVCSQSISLLLNVEGSLPGLGVDQNDSNKPANAGFTQLLQSVLRR